MTINFIFNIAAFFIITILWIGFGAALLFDPGTLDAIWQTIRGLPIIGQIVVGVLFLPVFLGLWIWESSWPLWLRLLLVIGLAFATVYTFFPRKE